MPHIPFQTLSDRHLVYAYVTVLVMQFGYAIHLLREYYRRR